MSKGATIAKGSKKPTSEDYIKLVRELPIRPLKSRSDYEAAQRMLDRLVGREDLTAGQVDYLAGLAPFVQDYEEQHAMGQLRRLKPVELLRHLMEENDMNTSDLGYVLGSRGLASEVLSGKRGLSKTLIRRLAERFGLPPSLFRRVAVATRPVI